MSDPLAGVRVRELPDGGVVYRLPVGKGVGPLLIGLVVFVFGLFFTCGAAGGLVGACVLFFGGDMFGLFLAGSVMALAVLALGVLLTLGGLWMALGHTDLRVAGGRLSAVLKIGPFPYVVRRRPLEQVARLAVIAGAERKGAELVAVCPGAKPLELANLYPYDLLWSVGCELAERCNAARPEDAEPLALEAEWSVFSGERPVQPALSRIVISDTDDGRTYLVPPAGWLSTALVLGLFGSVMGIFLLSMGLQLMRTDPKSPWWIVLAFLLVPAGLLVAAFAVARRHVRLTVADETLTLRRVGLFGARTRSWPREELARVYANREQRRVRHHSEAGVSTHWVWVTDLRIEDSSGNTEVVSGRYGLLARAVEQEWEWLATALRKELEVPG
jgi:hypothetical protein